MKNFIKYLGLGLLIISLGLIIWPSNASVNTGQLYYGITPPDSLDLPYPFEGEKEQSYSTEKKSGMFLKTPSNVVKDVEFDSKTNQYIFTEKMGNLNYRHPQTMSLDEYRHYDFDRSLSEYWRQKVKSESFQHQSSLVPKLNIGGEVFDRIFGSSTISIKPSGSAVLTFGLRIRKIDNPTIAERLRTTTTFDFKEEIQMNVTGQIGDKMKLSTNYNTEATFDFENKMNLAYEGKEDEIIQKIEAGDVSLPLTGSLITGSQSLFGLKTELKFGRLTATSIFSQQKGETSVIEVEGGAQRNQFEITVDDYEANKHFFLAQYFHDYFNESMASLPIPIGVNITKLEVWVTNKTANYENSRNIVGFMNLGDSLNHFENKHYLPDNETNDLYSMVSNIGGIRDISQLTNALESRRYEAGIDYEKIENARKLNESEYKFNRTLGYISLNSSLNADEVLAVAFQYSLPNGDVMQVGEFSNEGITAPQTLILKLIKGTALTPSLPNWRLMMKNIYAIGAYQVSQDGFELNVLYQNDKTGTALNYIPAGDIDGKQLLQVLNLDNFNSQSDPYPDGFFDFIEGYTINSSNGRVVFPVIEPFGEDLRKAIKGEFNEFPDNVADPYVFEELYDSTQSTARQMAEKNKFLIVGTYKSSSSSDIPLNAFNIPQGSVTVTAGGIQLNENIDYTVDYTLGRVKIINPGLLESGTPIKISLESQSLFSIQSKTLLGTHLNYKISDDFNIGGTILNLTERPLTTKVTMGDEPISNTIWGLNGTYRTEAPFITKMVDMLPFLETKEKSNITIVGEFAHLIPGHSKAINKQGVSYIDDFEGSKTSIDQKTKSAWVLASTPPEQFEEAKKTDDLSYGYNRAKLAWYVVDPLFLRDQNATPGHLSKDDVSNHFVREVFEKEIFPNKESQNNIPTNIQVLNLAYYPSEKGPYNYDVDGVEPDGSLSNPEDRWGGIMRKLETSDFETQNIEFIEFWMMDPFVDNEKHKGGELYFNLGNVSEDILKDSRKTFENGLPTDGDLEQVHETKWGRIPKQQSLAPGFDLNNRKAQDVGLDGLNNSDEQTFFSDYLQSLETKLAPEVYSQVLADPSNDDYHYFRGSDYDDAELSVLERYKKYNGLEGNSPSTEDSGEQYSTSSSARPDVEDINGDNTLSEAESYFEYNVPLNPTDMEIGKNYITDMIEADVTFKNDETSKVKWYQFKIPVRDGRAIGTINDFKSVRFMRMFLTGFEEDIILRFAKLDLVRSEWRKYNFSLRESVFTGTEEASDGSFNISAVNIEENGKKSPVNYILPPGVNRQQDPTNPQMTRLNEQAILLKVMDLADGDARAAYRNIDMDIRQYKRLQMYVHAEEVEGCPLEDDELKAFIRIGSDYKNNYYEYEIPLKLTEPGVYAYTEDDPDSKDRKIVWANDINIKLDSLIDVKEERNSLLRSGGYELTKPYVKSMGGGKRITVRGNPSLSNVRTIMIGIRNPHQQNNSDQSDDGFDKCAEVWMNELRLSDFDEKGGWAANARVQTKLADFGMLSVAGSTSKAGFGSIEKKVQERSKEDRYQYDIASNMELGKFLPEKANVSVPMYVAFSEGFITPEYNPLDPDVKYKDVIKDTSRTKEEIKAIKKIAQDYTRRKSLNFTNVKINKSGGKARIYDISNWSLNYSYSETFKRNVTTEYDIQKFYKGGVAYNFNTTPKDVSPFRKSKSLKSPTLKLIKDFNFYYMPQQFSFRSDLDRLYNERQLRNIANNNYGSSDIDIPVSVRKDFSWNRIYDLKYKITKSLNFNFSATNTARIDEPEGVVDKELYKDEYEIWRDSVMQNLKDFGRTTNYHHQYSFDYKIPINKIPLFNWTTSSVRYSGSYDWLAGPILPAGNKRDIGNTIKNANTWQFNERLNLVNLYKKVGYLERIEKKYRKRGRRKKPKKEYEKVVFPKDDTVPFTINLKANQAKFINHKLGTEDVEIKAFDSSGRPLTGELKIINEEKVTFKVKKDYDNAIIKIIGNKEVKESILKLILENTTNLALSVRNFNITYSENNGTFLPGYKPKTNILGQQNYNNLMAPGLPFAFGVQDSAFIRDFGTNGWLTKDTTMIQTYMMTHTENLKLRSTVEPIKNFRIDITANRSFSDNMNMDYYYEGGKNKYRHSNQMNTGNFSMSYNTWSTAFEKMGDDYSSEAFETFKQNRITIANRLIDELIAGRKDNSPAFGGDNPSPFQLDSLGFPVGFSSSSQQVLLSAFLAAYSGQSADNISLETFPKAIEFKPFRINIKPNWRISYDGLSKIKKLKKIFKKITLSHAYRSSYSIGAYTRPINYRPDREDGISYVRDLQENYIPDAEINTVTLSEQISPLIGVNIIWKNSLITKIEIKRSRNITLSFANNQLSETIDKEFVIGLGYRFKDFEIIVGKGGGQKKFKSDLNLRTDLSIKDNFTVMRIIEGDTKPQLLSGRKRVTLKFTADYVLSEQFNVQAFYDWAIDRPKISTSFNSMDSYMGVSVRFTLPQ